jgi:3-isopropylmalate dehydratase small subunit
MGTAYKFGDNIDTDVILPGQYLSFTDPQVLAKHCMEGYDPSLVGKLKKGDIFVAGKNFGCGSSREGAPVAIRSAGISCVIGKSFARIFYRNAINIGMPVLESPEAVDGISEGDNIDVDLADGKIFNRTTGERFSFPPFPANLREIIDAGGLKRFYQQSRK